MVPGVQVGAQHPCQVRVLSLRQWHQEGGKAQVGPERKFLQHCLGGREESGVSLTSWACPKPLPRLQVMPTAPGLATWALPKLATTPCPHPIPGPTPSPYLGTQTPLPAPFLGSRLRPQPPPAPNPQGLPHLLPPQEWPSPTCPRSPPLSCGGWSPPQSQGGSRARASPRSVCSSLGDAELVRGEEGPAAGTVPKAEMPLGVRGWGVWQRVEMGGEEFSREQQWAGGTVWLGGAATAAERRAGHAVPRA